MKERHPGWAILAAVTMSTSGMLRRPDPDHLPFHCRNAYRAVTQCRHGLKQLWSSALQGGTLRSLLTGRTGQSGDSSGQTKAVIMLWVMTCPDTFAWPE